MHATLRLLVRQQVIVHVLLVVPAALLAVDLRIVDRELVKCDKIELEFLRSEACIGRDRVGAFGQTLLAVLRTVVALFDQLGDLFVYLVVRILHDNGARGLSRQADFY